LELLNENDVDIDYDQKTAFIPNDLVKKALKGPPSSFKLYGREGIRAIKIGGDKVWFAPGTTSVNFLDHETN